MYALRKPLHWKNMMMTDSEREEVQRKAVNYPEHCKIIQIKHQAKMLARFAKWAKEKRCIDLPKGPELEDMILEFFGIDLVKIQAEKEKMLSVMKPVRNGTNG